MELKDLFLTPIYLGIFYAIAYAVRPRVTNAFTRPYFIPGLSVKFLGAVALGLIYQLYYKGGDTFNYYDHARIVYGAFGDSFSHGLQLLFRSSDYNPALSKYMAGLHWYESPTEYTVVQVATVGGLLCFNTYSVIALMFAGLSFSGMWAMYITFVRIFPLAYKRLALAVFFLPSVFFWGSGIMKDSLCMGALGWTFYGFYHLTVAKRHKLTAAIMGLAGAYVLSLVKVYILLSFLPPALFWIFIENNRRIKSALLRTLLKPVFLILGVGAGYLGATNLTAGDERYDVDKIGERTKINQEYLYGLTKDSGSSYNIGSFDGSLGSLVTVAPQAIVVTLFRPFPWEVRNAVMLLSSMEAVLFIYLTVSMLVRTGPVRSFRIVASTPVIIFSLVFSLVFAVGVGTNSGNFGTLVRYKIPLMPFFLGALFIMQHKATAKIPQLSKARNSRRLAVTE